MRSSPREAASEKRRRIAYPALLAFCTVLFAHAPDLSSTAGRGQPYFESPEKLGLMFEYGSYEAEVAGNAVWAAPSLPGLLRRAEGKPIAPNVKLKVAELYQRLGLAQQALELYEQLINEAEGSAAQASGLFALQKFFYEIGDYGRTVSSLELVAKYNRPLDLAGARYLAGQAYLKLATPVRAIPVLEAVGEDAAEGPFARYSLGLAYAQQNKFASAKKAFEETVAWGRRRTAPRRVRLVGADGRAEVRIVEAELYPEERSALEAVVAKGNLALGYLSIENKKYAEASKAFSEIPEDSPYYPEALYAKAWSQIYQGNPVPAIVTLNKLVKSVPGGKYTQEAMLLIGSSYVNLKAYDRAIRAYQEAVEYYTGERALAHQVIDEPFLRQNFEMIRLYFDPAASNELLDPQARLDEDARKVFARVVTNPEVRSWFGKYAEMGSHLRSLRARTLALEQQSAVVDEKLRQIGNVQKQIEGELGERVSRLRQEYQLLDDRINMRGQSIDIWQLASRKETELLKEYGQHLARVRKLEQHYKELLKQYESRMDEKSRESAEQTRLHLRRVERIIEALRGELAWKIIGSTNITAGGVARAGQGASAVRTALLNKELSKIKGQIERAEEKVRGIREEVDATRARYTDLKRRYGDLAGRQTELLRQTERTYLSLGERVIQQVTRIYKEYDGRLERFVAEAEFGVIGALDRQASQ